jgi:Ca2+-binding RTX toxin-like protein
MVANLNTINGTPGDDFLFGDTGINNLIFGFGGNDDITTGDGNDTVYSGSVAGNTTSIDATAAKSAVIYLGDGNDTVSAGAGAVTVYGGAGGDTVFGGSGNLKFFGSKTPNAGDFIIGGSGDDIILGGAGNDTLIGGFGSDFVSGDPAGNNTIYSHATRVTKPSIEKDIFYGGGGNPGASTKNTFYLESNYLGKKNSDTPAREGKLQDDSYAVIEDFRKSIDTLGLLNKPINYTFKSGNFSNGAGTSRGRNSDTFISYKGNTVAIVLNTRLTQADVGASIVQSPSPVLPLG